MTNKTISLYKVFREMDEGDVWKTSYKNTEIHVVCTGDMLMLYEIGDPDEHVRLLWEFKHDHFGTSRVADIVEQWEMEV